MRVFGMNFIIVFVAVVLIVDDCCAKRGGFGSIGRGVGGGSRGKGSNWFSNLFGGSKTSAKAPSSSSKGKF